MATNIQKTDGFVLVALPGTERSPHQRSIAEAGPGFGKQAYLRYAAGDHSCDGQVLRWYRLGKRLPRAADTVAVFTLENNTVHIPSAGKELPESSIAAAVDALWANGGFMAWPEDGKLRFEVNALIGDRGYFEVPYH